MNDEQLRSRLTASDPLPDGAPIHPYESTRARSLLEAAMSTEIDHPIDDTTHDTTHDTAQGTTGDAGDGPGAAPPIPIHRRPRRGLVAALAVAAVAALAVGGAAIGGAFDGTDDDPSIAVPDDPTGGPDEPATKLKVLELSTGDVDPSMMMCIALDATVVSQSPVAFKATVDTVDAELVTMTVDEWYQGGDAQVVSLTAPEGMQALLGGIDFVPGQQYLVSAVDGVISYCGLSGPATPELQALYDEAFPG